MGSPPRSKAEAALWLLAVVLAMRLVIISVRAAALPAHGFVAHYAASRLVVEGVDVARFYDDSVMVGAVHRFEPGVIDVFGANPPTVAAAALPLAGLEYRTARLAWTLLGLCLWFGATVWLARVAALRGAWAPALLCVAAVFEPAAEHLRHAQFHIPFLVLVLIAWRGARERRGRVTGASLAAALVLKAAGLVFWPLLAAQRRWRSLTWATGLVAASAIAFLPFAGVRAWAAFLGRARALRTDGSLSVPAYQSLSGLVRRLTVFDARWNPQPLFALDHAGVLVAWVFSVMALAAGLIVAAKRKDDIVFASFAALGLALSPVSLEYHYVLAIFPIAVLLGRHQTAMSTLPGVTLAIATAMIATRLPYLSPALADGAPALLAYPRLYGALVLAALGLATAWTERGAVESLGAGGQSPGHGDRTG